MLFGGPQGGATTEPVYEHAAPRFLAQVSVSFRTQIRMRLLSVRIPRRRR
jgi:hypothetical protein